MNNLLSFRKKVGILTGLLLMLVFPITGQCDYTMTATVTHSDCLDNGVITMNITGLDASLTPNYRVYAQSDNPDNVPWSTSNRRTDLPAGMYVAESRVHCISGAEQIEVIRSRENLEVRQTVAYEAPKFVLIVSRNALLCSNSGAIQLTNITSSTKGPFVVEILDAPQEYIDDNGGTLPILIHTSPTKLASTYTIDNVYAGNYVVKLTDGCAVSSDASITVPMLTGSDAIAPNLFDINRTSSSRPHIHGPMSLNANDWQSTANSLAYEAIYYGIATTDPRYSMYEYLINWGKYYDYAFLFPGEAAADLPEERWLSTPDGTSPRHVLYTSPDYTLRQMRENANYRPQRVAVRTKATCSDGTHGMAEGSNLSLLSPYFQNFNIVDVANACDNKTISFRWYADHRGVLAYPYTWMLERMDVTNAIVEDTVRISEPVYDRNYVYVPDTLGLGRYRLTCTDADGWEYVYSFDLSAGLPVLSSAGSTGKRAVSADVCFLGSDSVSSFLAGASLPGAKIVFNRATTHSSIPSPPWWTSETDTLFIPKNWTGTYYLYGENGQLAGSYLSTMDQWPYYRPGTTSVNYNRFTLIDSCGRTRTVDFGSTYRYEYYRKPAFDPEVIPNLNITYDCGYAVLSVPDIANFIGNRQYLLGSFGAPRESNMTAYYRIVPVSGVVISYSSGGNRNDSPTQTVRISRGGKYKLQVAYEVGFNPSVCLFTEYEIDIDIPEFTLDKARTAAYRCPNNDQEGYIQIELLHGSGNYEYWLYDPSDTGLTSPLESNTTGIFTDWANQTTADELVLRARDVTCGREFIERFDIYDLDNATVAWVGGSTRKCVGDVLRLNAMPLGDGATYSWIFPDGTGSSSQYPVINGLTLAHSGEYVVNVSIPGCSGTSSVEVRLNVSVADETMYWNPNALSANWHDKANWLIINDGGTPEVANAIPAPCTTVHIPGNALVYPNLDRINTPREISGEFVGAPACDTIIYHYGSETIYPHLLRYSRAKVQYNFGYYNGLNFPEMQPFFNIETNTYPNYAASGESSPVLARARWYMIASPLKHVTGGDFGLGGYPHMYQRLYNAASPMNGFAHYDSYTRPYNTLSTKIEDTSHALALLVPDFYNSPGWDNHARLEAMNGIIELPYYMENNPTVMGYHMQTYDAGTQTSKFQYYNTDTFAPEDRYDELVRDYRGYRFVFESNQDTVSVALDKSLRNVAMARIDFDGVLSGSTLNRIMIGNPLMSHIDFDKVYAYNDDVIKDNYWLANEDEVFYSYRAGNPDPINPITKDIAPLQGFIVELLPNRIKDYLLLPMEGDYDVISTASGLPKPRVSQFNESPKGYISVYGVTPPSGDIESKTDSIRVRSSILFNYDLDNVPKLILPEGLSNKAETFIIGSDGSINTEQVENTFPSTIKLGLESLHQKDVTLEFSIGGDIVASAVLFDKVLGVRVDVSDGGSYRFKHRADRTERMRKGLDSERFELSVTYRDGTGLKSSDIHMSVSADRDHVKVLSSEMISEVDMVDMAGSLLFRTTDIASDNYRRNMVLPSGVYIVTVKMKDGQRKTFKTTVQ